jgi:hypothetical protein
MTTIAFKWGLMRFLHAVRDFLKGVFSDHSSGPRCC